MLRLKWRVWYLRSKRRAAPTFFMKLFISVGCQLGLQVKVLMLSGGLGFTHSRLLLSNEIGYWGCSLLPIHHILVPVPSKKLYRIAARRVVGNLELSVPLSLSQKSRLGTPILWRQRRFMMRITDHSWGTKWFFLPIIINEEKSWCDQTLEIDLFAFPTLPSSISSDKPDG